MRKWILAIVGVLLGSMVFVLLSGSDEKGELTGFGIPLVRAAVSANFLEEEAGIAAYFKAPSTINLALARDAYVVVERDESDYLLGWVAPQAGNGEFNVRVYTASNGWVVAYYLRGEATSKIVDLTDTGTRLEQVLERIAGAAGLSVTQIGYSHYQYPEANALMVITKSSRTGGRFSFTIPDGAVISESSYALYATDGLGYGSRDVALLVRGTEVAQGKRWTPGYGFLTTALLRNAPTEASVESNGVAAVVFVYQQ